MKWIAQGVLLALVWPNPANGQQAKEPIGELFGKPIERQALESKSVQQVFLGPVLQKYRQAHKASIVPTEAEIEAARAYFDQKHKERMGKDEPMLREQLQAIEGQLREPALTDKEKEKLRIEKTGLEARLRPPGKFFAQFMLDNWKFQIHLYDRYGGGRILWQQAGLEAFDATRTWIETQERNGEFKISDPKLRAELYAYWTTQNHGAFLTDDKERIRQEFLEPAWAPKSKPDGASRGESSPSSQPDK